MQTEVLIPQDIQEWVREYHDQRTEALLVDPNPKVREAIQKILNLELILRFKDIPISLDDVWYTYIFHFPDQSNLPFPAFGLPPWFLFHLIRDKIFSNVAYEKWILRSRM